MNPSFPITSPEADRDLRRIAATARPLDRPLVIVGGFIDPGLAPLIVRMRIDSLVTDKRIIVLPMGFYCSFEQCRRAVIDAVDRAFPGKAPGETTEVDVLGLSMGGLVARYAALPVGPGHPRRLNIARLFTISSPLNGADGATKVPAILHPLIAPMRPGSPLVEEVNAQEPPYPVFSYVCLRDAPVGARYASVRGRQAWWLSPPFYSAHMGAHWDSRILADIARRLRGEPPLATDPPAPLPPKCSRAEIQSIPAMS